MISKHTIHFNEELHKYTDELNRPYTSVTQLISRYEEEFDTMKWATYKAKERGVDVGVILAEWKQTNKISIDIGNATHKELEDDINKIYQQDDLHIIDTIEKSKKESLDYAYKIVNEDELNKLSIKEKYPSIYWELLTAVKEGWVICSEKRVYNPNYLIAGTIDVFMLRGNEFKILDWKTNKDELKFVSGYYKKEWQNVNGVMQKVKTNKFVNTREYLKYPINNVMQCKGMIYTLQLSLYAYLAEQFGLKCRGLKLCHLKSSDVNPTPKFFNITYLQSDVFRMLEHHRDSLDSKPKKKNLFEI